MKSKNLPYFLKVSKKNYSPPYLNQLSIFAVRSVWASFPAYNGGLIAVKQLFKGLSFPHKNLRNADFS